MSGHYLCSSKHLSSSGTVLWIRWKRNSTGELPAHKDHADIDCHDDDRFRTMKQLTSTRLLED
ncbi:hypothetical protein CpipJ_CPIJ016420 [Culex quinquefasciatus]|uniref:Uncharacterized protein n=1 Tax=Culex quinquefasciatus TaxID=7176 RepID=B0XA05_CULQU|nr:hypothetical protein CpipJ_CPIJ019578 [Culex quinquefasciatus]EDS30524.1 hypothetical protein CpipJ_CPIJ019582 [Culex quinquefasciatus]EDS43431.1 hypothetical protein CpipJ_CPIJ016420 [Culex quinquefasciatus]|eukprot:XP_001866477.1 hypothetical protein CpipJ_CPIJ016420 [Culex quinquefasciatus]